MLRYINKVVEKSCDVAIQKGSRALGKSANPFNPILWTKFPTCTQKSSFSSSKIAHEIALMPSARAIISKNHLPLEAIHGSGKRGTILKEDVLNFLTHPTAKQPVAPPKIIEVSRDDFPRPVASAKASPPSGGYTDIPHTSVSKTAAGRLLKSKISIPHIYLSAQILLNSLLKFQQKANSEYNLKLSLNDLLLRAVVLALRENPEVNGFWDGISGSVKCYSSIHLGVSTPSKSVVIADADFKTPSQLSALQKVSADGQGTFRVFCVSEADSAPQAGLESGSAIDELIEIVGEGQVGVLTLGRALRTVGVDETGNVAVNTTLKVSLAADQRVVDPETGGRFLETLKNFITVPENLLLK